jgi:predicted DNA-binding protein
MTKPTPRPRPGPGIRVSGAIYDAVGNSVTVYAHISADAYQRLKQLQKQTGDTQAGAFRALIFRGAESLGFRDSVSAMDAVAAANGGASDARAVHHLIRLGAKLSPILSNPPTP